MIKLYCDSCGNEITDRSEIGNFTIQEKVVGWLKHQKQDQIKRSEHIFCSECARKIRDFFQKKGE